MNGLPPAGQNTLVAKINGYTSSTQSVNSVAVSAKTADTTIDVYYLADQPTTINQVTPETLDEPVEQSTSLSDPSNGSDTLVTLSPTKEADHQSSTKAKQMTLPQTGNDQSTAILGLGLASTAALIGMLGFSKKKQQ